MGNIVKARAMRIGKSAAANGPQAGTGSQTSGLLTNAISVGTFTNLFALPAAGTAPCSSATTSDYTFTTTVKIAIDIGGTTYYLIADTS